MGIMIHGFASPAVQGVVSETLELSGLRDYTTGVKVHVFVKIEFKTDFREAHSSPYPTDVAKTVGTPIFHVNGDCPNSVVKLFKLAMEYRQRFQKDVVIDLFCYCRNCINELDKPIFTQAHMYIVIKQHDTLLAIYSKQILREGIMTEAKVNDLIASINASLTDKFIKSKDWKPSDQDWLLSSSNWLGMKSEQLQSEIRLKS